MKTLRLTIVDRTCIGENKQLYSTQENMVKEVSSLEELAKLMCQSSILPAVFKVTTYEHNGKQLTGRRRQAYNVEGIDMIGFDFDDGSRIDEVTSRLNEFGCSYIMVGSKNHMKDKGDGKGAIPRFHVFIPLLDTIKTSEDYSLLWQSLVAQFRFKIGARQKNQDERDVIVDGQAKDVVRYFYQHSVVIAIKDCGLLDASFNISKQRKVVEFLNMVKQKKQELKKKKVFANDTFEDKVNRFVKRHENKDWFANINTAGCRHRSSLAFAGAMKSWDFTRDEAWAVYCELYSGSEHAHHEKNFDTSYQ